MTKRRVSVSIDADLVAEAEAAVRSGAAATMSAYVSDALKAHIEHQRRLRAGEELFRRYEAEHGVITDEQMDAAYREAQRRAADFRASWRASRASERKAPYGAPRRGKPR